MIRWLRLVLAALLALGAPLLVGAALPPQPANEEDRQILVMLTMPAAHYHRSSEYGGGAYGDLASQAARNRAARRIAARNGAQLREGWPMPVLGVDCFVMFVPPGKPIDEVIAAVAREPGVAWSQRMTSYAMPGAGNGDPLYPAQPTAGEWKLRELQRTATGRGEKIAIVDSQVDLTHPDLAGQFVANQNFVAGPPSRPEAHGTHVAGLIGARAGNGIGMAGVAPGARLMALRACREVNGGRATLCSTLALAQALQFAVEHQADVINLSLSGPRDQLLEKLLDVAIARKIAIVAAYDQAQPGGGFPASLPGVVPVADEALQSLPAGVYGAPGRDLPTTQPGGGWGLVNGSSYAVAQVSGLLALAGERGRRPLSTSLVRGGDGKVEACETILGRVARCR